MQFRCGVQSSVSLVSKTASSAFVVEVQLDKVTLLLKNFEVSYV